jgi:hypothetical protein
MSEWFAPSHYFVWSPPGSIVDTPEDRVSITTLLKADPAAFQAVESQMASTALLAETTAAGLVAAQHAPDWTGEAAAAYVSSVGKLPGNLDVAHNAFFTALQALTHFSDQTFANQSKLRGLMTQIDGLDDKWSAALETAYPNEQVGTAALSHLQAEMTSTWRSINNVLETNYEDWQAFASALKPATAMAPKVPPPSVLHRILAPLTDLVDTIGATGSRIKNYIDDPSLGNLGKLTESLSLDAGIIALAAGGTEALAGASLADAGGDSAVASASHIIGDIAGTSSLGLYGLNIDADLGQGRYGSAALKSLLIYAPDAKDLLATTELDRTLNDQALLSDYKSALGNGKNADKVLASLDPEDAKQIKALVKDYGDPGAVAKAQATVAADLKAARATAAKDDATDNAKEHLLKDPAVKAGGDKIDGSEPDEPDSGDGSTGSDGCGPNLPPGMQIPLEPGPTGLAS